MEHDEFEIIEESINPIEMDFSEIEGKIVYPERKKKHPSWLWASVPLAAVAVSGIVIGSLYAGGVLPGLNNSSLSSNRLVTPTTAKIQESPVRSLSDTTYSSYMEFTSRFSKLAINQHIATDGETSYSVSIPDAYMCFALVAITSTSGAQKDILDYMGLDNVDDLKTAAREVVSSLCTLKRDSKTGSLSGGYNLNSLWFNMAKVGLRDKDSALYDDLASIFDASVYREALTSEAANRYLAEEGLEGLATPVMSFDDTDPFAAAVMSVFYCLDGFEQRDIYKAQYDSATHKMDYDDGNKVSKVDYIHTANERTMVYEGNGFTGSRMTINKLAMECFLPDDKDALPSSILDDVLSSNYGYKSYTDSFGYPTSLYTVNMLVPYFKLDNHVSFSHQELSPLFPSITQSGFTEKMAYGLDGDIFFSILLQQSVVSFDYEGFYSCSVTIAGGEPESAPGEQQYSLEMDHPFLFMVNQPGVKTGDKSNDIPMVIGEIITPEYGE